MFCSESVNQIPPLPLSYTPLPRMFSSPASKSILDQRWSEVPISPPNLLQPDSPNVPTQWYPSDSLPVPMSSSCIPPISLYTTVHPPALAHLRFSLPETPINLHHPISAAQDQRRLPGTCPYTERLP